MPTTSNFGWTTPADTDLVKDGAAAIRTLGNGIDTSFLDLKGGTTGQVLSKASNTDLDFSWVAQDDSNAIQNAIVDAKGDLISATAADTPARLAVGANGTVLTADSAEATGLKWATPSTTSGLTLITSTTISNATSKSVDNCFTSTYANYLIKVVITSGASDSGTATLKLRASSTDTSTNYDYRRIYASSSSVTTDTNIVGTDEFLIGNVDKDNVNGFDCQLYNPQAATHTAYTCLGSGYYNSAVDNNIVNGTQQSATQFDGFTLLGNANMTGTIRVYGYQNS